MTFTVKPTLFDYLSIPFSTIILIVIAVLVAAAVLMALWNYVMPVVFGLRRITYGQALALLIISAILFK